MRQLLGWTAILALTGCTMIPPWERPASPVADRWPSVAAPEDGAQASPAASLTWQEFFLDERLREVIRRALAGNRDLAIAALNVERAGALLRIERSARTPSVGVRAAGERYRLPESSTDSGEAETISQYSVNLGFLSWEIDLFGRVRSLGARALEQYLATAEARRAVETSLVAATASAWMQLAADSASLRLAGATLAAQETSRDLIRASRDAGIAADFDLRQADSQVETARLAQARFAGVVAVDRNALERLLGAPLPEALLPEDFDRAGATRPLVAGLPSEVLLDRPDIRAAEHRLRAANAQIGVARAAFFPRISLTAALGTLSPDLEGLFGSGTRTWSFAPQVDAPLFAGGGLRAGLRGAKVEREIAVAQYEKAIQAAFAEVADALALGDSLRAQSEAIDELVAALAEVLRLAEARYRAGVDGYLGVLVAQRALYDAEQTRVDLQFAERANQVALYRALGGGAPPREAGAD
ncbi:MAG: efflux transporter outer membrane subunit [Thermoanaerobaculia bacterium]|nr:MAG: efflux transporter outer membrane subunit [Thermoanaerobaculia bacterium]MBZ0100847.1 efflux transporter outer membrane subunit [Thermoanaerobaculia bacterium]